MRSTVLLTAALVVFAAPALAQSYSIPAGDIHAAQPPVDWTVVYGGIDHTPVYQGRSVAIDVPHVVHHKHR